MNLLTNVFYLISTALLIPVMLVLLVSLVQVLLVLGQVLREFLVRSRHAAALAAYGEALMHNTRPLPDLSPNGGQADRGRRSRPRTCAALVPDTLSHLAHADGDPVLAEKLVADAEIAWRDEVERIAELARRGPAFGLMGTLIPLGPALVGLAAGNLQTMAENLVIAFATTVVGLLVATLAGAIVGLKKRWYRADAALVGFALGRALEQASSARHAERTGDRQHGAHPVRHAASPAGGNNGSKTAEPQPQAAEAC